MVRVVGGSGAVKGKFTIDENGSDDGESEECEGERNDEC